MRFRFGDHLLDLECRELRRDSRLVAVEPQVFDLLLYLVRNRERVVSKDDLIGAIWGGRIVSDATINSRVKALRHAVGDSGASQALIRTFPRKGIRFVGDAEEEGEAAPIPASPAAGPVQPALALPDKPSIAVLPFTNMSSDPEQEFFADGIAEDIITALSRYHSLFVIARNSSFTYRDRSADVRQIGRELGVRYVLEGSLRKAGGQIRLTAQLIEAESGNHLWAERYDRGLADIFAVQDEITEAIARQTVPAVSHAEQRRAMRKPPDSLDAWEAYQRGLGHLTEARDSDIAMGREFFQRAADLDPQFAPAQAMLGHVTLNETSRGKRPFEEGRAVAEHHARCAIALDPDDPGGYYVLSWVCTWQGNFDAALQHAENAVATGPNDARAHLVKARALICMGRSAEADPYLQTALRLSPRDPFVRLVLLHLSMAAYQHRDYEAAAAALRRCMQDFPGYPHQYLWLAAALGQLGRTTEAKDALAKAVDVAPALFDASYRHRMWLRPEDYEHFAEGLRKAGWSG